MMDLDERIPLWEGSDALLAGRIHEALHTQGWRFVVFYLSGTAGHFGKEYKITCRRSIEAGAGDHAPSQIDAAKSFLAGFTFGMKR